MPDQAKIDLINARICVSCPTGAPAIPQDEPMMIIGNEVYCKAVGCRPESKPYIKSD